MDLTKSVIGQLFDALRTPLVGYEQTISKVTKGGKSIRTVHKGNLPAWFVLGGAITALLWMKQRTETADPASHGWDWWFGPFGLH